MKIELDPERCPVCQFMTRENGVLQHEDTCRMKGQSRAIARDKPNVTDAMRMAAWQVYPNADVPYTEIYWAMELARREHPNGK